MLVLGNTVPDRSNLRVTANVFLELYETQRGRQKECKGMQNGTLKECKGNAKGTPRELMIVDTLDQNSTAVSVITYFQVPSP